MTWSYTGAPQTSDLDALRLLTGDTDSAHPLLTDEELQYFIGQYPDMLEAGAATCDAIAAKFARLTTWSGDGISVSVSDLQDKYTRLAQSLRAQFQDIGKLGLPDAAVTDRGLPKLPIFSLAMTDNPEAGKQWAGGQVWYEPLKSPQEEVTR